MNEGMLLIKKIEWIKVDRNPAQLMVRPERPLRVDTSEGPMTQSVGSLNELVHGRRYVRPSDGLEVMVGMSLDTQDILGLHYDMFDNQTKELEQANATIQALHNNLKALRITLDVVSSENFWQRLKRLFTFK